MQNNNYSNMNIKDTKSVDFAVKNVNNFHDNNDYKIIKSYQNIF